MWPGAWPKEQSLYITFLQSDWFIAQNKRFWLAITTRNSYHKNSESSKAMQSWTFIHENTISTVQLLQILKQNYNHFLAKHTHWHLQRCKHGTSHLERSKHWRKKRRTVKKSWIHCLQNGYCFVAISCSVFEWVLNMITFLSIWCVVLHFDITNRAFHCGEK